MCVLCWSSAALLWARLTAGPGASQAGSGQQHSADRAYTVGQAYQLGSFKALATAVISLQGESVEYLERGLEAEVPT